MKRSLSALLALTLVAACDARDSADQPAPDDGESVQAPAESPAPEPEPEAEEAPAEPSRLAIKAPASDSDLELRRAEDTEVAANASANGIGDLKAGKKVANSGEGQSSGTLGLRGAGRGGGGISSRGIGLANVGTAGRGGGGRGTGHGYGKSSANLGARPTHAPAPMARRERVGTESYKDYGVNKFTDASEDRHSTFSIDVDTGSYTIARRKLNQGVSPPAAAVRVEEFVNYFDYDYPEPDSGAFSVSTEAAPSPFDSDGKRFLMRVGVQGKTIAASERKPVHLTFLVDVSGSMRSADKIGLVKKSLNVLTDNLREQDTVAIATYAGRTEVVLKPTGLKHRQRIFDAVDGLGAGGSTAMASGLQLAYGLAESNFRPDHENRVIVLSDGDANVGRRRHQDLRKQIGEKVKKGITLSTIGFGMGNYQDTLMEQLADTGNGNYFYVDSEKEAQKIFGDQLDGTLQVIAKDVKIQVEFNPDAVYRYRLIGYENRDIADKDFRNDKVDAGEIGAGHTVTALYELELVDTLPDRIATVRVRHKQPHGTKAAEQTFALDRDELHTTIGASSRDFQFAASVAAFAEKLRNSPYAEHIGWDWILEIANGATRGKAQRKELVSLIQKARQRS